MTEEQDGTKEEGKKISLTVVSQDGNEIFFQARTRASQDAGSSSAKPRENSQCLICLDSDPDDVTCGPSPGPVNCYPMINGKACFTVEGHPQHYYHENCLKDMRRPVCIACNPATNATPEPFTHYGKVDQYGENYRVIEVPSEYQGVRCAVCDLTTNDPPNVLMRCMCDKCQQHQGNRSTHAKAVHLHCARDAETQANCSINRRRLWYTPAIRTRGWRSVPRGRFFYCAVWDTEVDNHCPDGEAHDRCFLHDLRSEGIEVPDDYDDDTCFLCGYGGTLFACDNCNRWYHRECLPGGAVRPSRRHAEHWCCPFC